MSLNDDAGPKSFRTWLTRPVDSVVDGILVGVALMVAFVLAMAAVKPDHPPRACSAPCHA